MKKEFETRGQSKAHALFLKHKGYLRASDAFSNGIQPRDLYALRDQGVIELVTRGLFRLKSLPELKSPSHFAIGVKIPEGVLCLRSALAVHGLIEDVPNEISVALVKGSERPHIHDLPIKFYLISEPAFSQGIEVHRKEGVDVRVYCPEKSIADCFKFRNKIGLKVCLDALQTWWKWENRNDDRFLSFVKTCRMENIIRPYLNLLSLQTSKQNSSIQIN